MAAGSQRSVPVPGGCRLVAGPPAAAHAGRRQAGRAERNRGCAAVVSQHGRRRPLRGGRASRAGAAALVAACRARSLLPLGVEQLAAADQAGDHRLDRCLPGGAARVLAATPKKCSSKRVDEGVPLAMGDVRRPAWWAYPVRCQHGHPWGPGRVAVSWSPCGCAPARAGQPRGPGHLTVRCRAEGCRSVWYKPRHDQAGQKWRAGARYLTSVLSA